MEDNEKSKKKQKKRGILKTIGNVLFWVIIVCLFATWITDFVRTQKDEKPVFCVKKIEHKYDDGTTEETNMCDILYHIDISCHRFGYR